MSHKPTCERPITKRFEFDAGHRVLGHEGKCACLHGHRYAAEITVQGKELDGIGRVVDFGVIKERVGRWIDAHWDHNIILHHRDPLLAAYLNSSVMLSHVANIKAGDIFGNRAPYIMPGDRNPTAEEMAYELYTVCVVELFEVEVVKVRIYETPTCWADYIPLPEYSP